jgi:hypothetical protein
MFASLLVTGAKASMPLVPQPARPRPSSHRAAALSTAAAGLFPTALSTAEGKRERPARTTAVIIIAHLLAGP